MANMLMTRLLSKAVTTLGTMKYVGRRPVHEFVDGKPTDKIIAFRYDIVLPDMLYSKISVRVPGAAQLDEPAEPYDVTLKGLQIVPYTRDNSVELSFRADTIKAAR